MACETKLRPRQTVSERKAAIKKAIEKLSYALARGQVKAFVGPQGAIAFQGWDSPSRDGITDACGYRMIMATGSALARAAIEKAETMAGRGVDRKVIGQGIHSHDGGASWHGKG
jgi:hypothetical protein